MAEEIRQTLDLAYEAAVRRTGRTAAKIENVNSQIAQVAEWLHNPCNRPWLYMCGLPGNGKTTLARAIQMIYDKVSLRDKNGRAKWKFVTAKELAMWSTDNVERYNYYARSPWLIIDEVGEEPAQMLSYGNVLTPIADTLLWRYRERLATVMTSNLTAREIVDKYGPRIGDRMAEMARQVVFSNNSYRRGEEG